MADQTYKCSVCHLEKTFAPGVPAPVCHGKPMEAVPLPFCTKPPVDPESARLEDEGEPCNDGIVKPKK